MQAFYDGASDLMARVPEITTEAGPLVEKDRLLGTLRAMGRAMQAEEKVQFRTDAHAARFAEDLRGHYGAAILDDLAARKTDALAQDFPDERERGWIAGAVIAAGKVHGALGVVGTDGGDRGIDAERQLANHKPWDRER